MQKNQRGQQFQKILKIPKGFNIMEVEYRLQHSHFQVSANSLSRKSLFSNPARENGELHEGHFRRYCLFKMLHAVFLNDAY